MLCHMKLVKVQLRFSPHVYFVARYTDIKLTGIIDELHRYAKCRLYTSF